MNKKVVYGSIIGVIILAAAVYATVQYFHTTQVDLTVGEARQSFEVAFSVSCLSGETFGHDIVIQNNANVPLNAELSYQELNNTGGVLYHTNLPMNVTLAPNNITIANFTLTCDPVTEIGNVTGVINYEKIA